MGIPCPVTVEAGVGRQRSSAVWAMRGVWLFESNVPLCSMKLLQRRDHLEIGRDIRVVPIEMHVVEEDLDHVVNPAFRLQVPVATVETVFTAPF